MSAINELIELKQYFNEVINGIDELAKPDIDDGEVALERLHDIRMYIEEIRQEMKEE